MQEVKLILMTISKHKNGSISIRRAEMGDRREDKPTKLTKYNTGKVRIT